MNKLFETVTIEEIKEFKTENNSVVMVLKDGQEVTFDLMTDSYDRYCFNQMIDRIKVTNRINPHTNYTKAEGFTQVGNYHLKLNEVKKTCSVLLDPADVFSEMLEKKVM